MMLKQIKFRFKHTTHAVPSLAKMTTPMQQSILGLSLEQTLLDDDISIYSEFLNESEEKFNIVIQNKRNSFVETFYIHDKSIIKKYTGETRYTSEQQGTTLPVIVSQQSMHPLLQ